MTTVDQSSIGGSWRGEGGGGGGTLLRPLRGVASQLEEYEKERDRNMQEDECNRRRMQEMSPGAAHQYVPPPERLHQ